MLTHLRISNFALLDDVEIEFGPGMNALTGETGAGKSLLVDAVSLLRGGRASADVVRAGAEEARIEAVFEPPHGPCAEALLGRLERAGIEPADEGLIVRRLISKQGRSRVYINGALSTATVLGEVTGVLIELAGQHEHQSLADPSRHLEILDRFGELDLLRQQMAEAWERLVQTATALGEATLDERTRQERIDLLRFQRQELDDAGIEADEEIALKQERERLRASDKLLAASQFGEETLYSGEGAVSERLAEVVHRLSDAERSDARLAPLCKQIEDARLAIEDAGQELRRYASSIEADPERLAAIDERLDVLQKLFRKHRVDGSAGLLLRLAEVTRELGELENSDEARARLQAELERQRQAAAKLAGKLSEGRRRAADGLVHKVEEALARLAMPGARFGVPVVPVEARGSDEPAFVVDGRRLSRDGWDRTEFQLSANRGEELKPLNRVASGGELSRILLALKRVLERADEVATYVFDEVDAGIGGAVAVTVGKEIRAVAGGKQVLCITHLPQIASAADLHFRVEKQEHEGRVRTVVVRLSTAQRRDEIARMLSGALSPKARAHADEMLKQARD